MELFKLEIVTPNGVIFDDDVREVTLPGTEGEFGVLAKHATLATLLETGVISIVKSDGTQSNVAIDSGYVKVDENKTTCIVDGAVALEGEGSELAKAIEEAKTLLRKAATSDVAIAAAVSKVEQLSKTL